jgi:TonB family protein
MLSIPIIAEPPPEGAPKKRSSRQRIETLVYAELGPGNGGFPINLSEEGMAFQGIQPLEKGHVISIRFKLPGTHDKVEATGQVAWLNELGKGGGLQFIDLSQKTRHLIHHWLDLQAQPGNHTESGPVGAHQVEKKKIQSSSSKPSEGHHTHAASGAEANATVPLPSSAATSVRVAEAIARSVSTAELISSADSSQTSFRGAGSKRTWVMPFAIGMVMFPVIMIVIMVISGAISVQFRWPQRTTGANLAAPVAQSGTVNVPESPSRSGPGPAALTVPSSSRTQVPTVRTSISGSPAPESSPAKTVTPTRINSPKTSLQTVAAAKLRAPNPMTPAKSVEFVPPAFALPTKSEPAPQLPMISAPSSAPTPPVGAPARQGGKFEAPQLITRRDPVYPAVAKSAGISGSVELKFTITAEGNVRGVTAVKGNTLLAGAAVQAVRGWHYQSARLDGIPVEAQSTAIINFRAQ